MKKIIACLLLAAMTIGLLGCGPVETPETTAGTTAGTTAPTEATEPGLDANLVEGVLNVGYCKVDITPDQSMPLGGLGNNAQRMHHTVKHRLYISTTAMTDAVGETILVISVDLKLSNHTDLYRSMLAKMVGVPEGNIYVVATHTHAAPERTSGIECSQEYYDNLMKYYVESIKGAMADRRPATMKVGSIETESMNFVKHYYNVDANGDRQYFGDNFGTAVYDDTTRHTTDADPTMYMVQFDREGAKPVIWSNFRYHPHFDTNRGDKKTLSAESMGAMRTVLETKLDCEFMFLQGAAGNINGQSRITSEKVTNDSTLHGNLLAQYAIECLENNMEESKVDTFKIAKNMWEGPVNHDTDHLVAGALIVQNVWKASNNYSKAAEAGKPYGIRSPYQANSIISRKDKPATITTELNAVVISDEVAFVTSPNEPFDTLSVEMEAASPYKYSMYFGYTNGYTGYLPTAAAFEYTTYETDVAWYKSGAGEAIRDLLVDMLKTLHDQA